MADVAYPSVRPFVKWAGGKTQLLAEIDARLPTMLVEGRRYFEPFVGGGAVFFRLWSRGMAGACYLNDMNHVLAAAYVGVRDHVEDVIRELGAMTCSRAFFEETREKGFEGASLVEATARFIYLNKTCFNGLWRVNGQGRFNVPFGLTRKEEEAGKPPRVFCDPQGLRACAMALYKAKLTSVDFEIALEDAREGDVVYLDPPYWPLSKTSSFAAYTSDGFGSEDHARLARCAVRTAARGAFVLASGSSAPESLALWQEAVADVGGDSKLEMVSARRSINSKGNGRGAVQEMLATLAVRRVT